MERRHHWAKLYHAAGRSGRSRTNNRGSAPRVRPAVTPYDLHGDRVESGHAAKDRPSHWPDLLRRLRLMRGNFENTPIPFSVLIAALLALLHLQDRLGPNLWLGNRTIGGVGLHPLACAFEPEGDALPPPRRAICVRATGDAKLDLVSNSFCRAGPCPGKSSRC